MGRPGRVVGQQRENGEHVRCGTRWKWEDDEVDEKQSVDDDDEEVR